MLCCPREGSFCAHVTVPRRPHPSCASAVHLTPGDHVMNSTTCHSQGPLRGMVISTPSLQLTATAQCTPTLAARELDPRFCTGQRRQHTLGRGRVRTVPSSTTKAAATLHCANWIKCSHRTEPQNHLLCSELKPSPARASEQPLAMCRGPHAGLVAPKKLLGTVSLPLPKPRVPLSLSPASRTAN